MSKVTEARKKILAILEDSGRTVDRSISLRQIKEIVLNDDEWNESKEEKETQQKETPTEEDYRSGLDVLIDFFPDE